MTVEAMIWTWLYMGMAVGIFSLAVVIWAIWFEYKDKQ